MPNRARRRGLVAALAASALACAAGCRSSPPPVRGEARPAARSSTELLRELDATPRVRWDQALPAFHLLREKRMEATEFEELRRRFVAAGILPADWGRDPGRPIQRDQAAYLVCEILDIGGGAVMTLTGNSRRYALKECVYRGLMEPGPPGDPVTGPEMVSLLARGSRVAAGETLDAVAR